MSLFNTPNLVSQSKTGNYTVLSTDDFVTFNISAAATATLPTSTGLFSGWLKANRTGGQGIVYIQNASTSTANLTIAAASGDAIFGTATVAPNQMVQCSSNGMGTWYIQGFASATGQLQTSVPVTSANILAMNGAPVTLLPAPGSGSAYIVDDIVFNMTTTATAYANGGAVSFQYHGGSTAVHASSIQASVITAGAGTSTTWLGGAVATNGTTVTLNAGIDITNASAAFITGTGTANAIFNYRIITGLN